MKVLYEEVYDERSALIEFYLTNVCGTKPEVARREAIRKQKKNEKDKFIAEYPAIMAHNQIELGDAFNEE